MLKLYKFLFLGLIFLSILLCFESSFGNNNKNKSIKKTSPLNFKTIDWTDLMPKDDFEALINPPSYITDIEDKSEEDFIENQLKNKNNNLINDRYQQALVSKRIIPEMNEKAIRIPGFIVPLEFNDDQTVTQFFLVPFFGACIHVPPPPPNQIIFVNYPKGFKLDFLFDPFWILGTLKTTLVENDIATAAYSMQMDSIEAYTD
mgnify:CR=1 FL=1|tara:strand:- start:438 stop:1046 length:609 start_codon:yes stop_codon:yes gene_type:complete